MTEDVTAPESAEDTEGVAQESTAESAAETEQPSVVGELRDVGRHLASALWAAAGTEEAQTLKADLRRGMGDLRGEIDSALASDKVPNVKAKAEDVRGKAPSVDGERLRLELAGALRSLNRALDQFASSLEPADAASTDAPVDEPDEA
ncbi:MAG: hypothetical protein ACK2T6_02010 [Anaerolineae bacterium]